MASAPINLTKLTVPQLKALCKDRRVVGYSKLAKAALIQKLTDLVVIGNAPPGESPVLVQAAPCVNAAQKKAGTPASDATVVVPGPSAVTPQRSIQTTKNPRVHEKVAEHLPSSSLSGARLSTDLAVDNAPSGNANSVSAFNTPNTSSVQATPRAPIKPLAGAKRPSEGDTSGMTTKKTKTSTESLPPSSSGPPRQSSVQPSGVFKVPAVPGLAQVVSSVQTSLSTARPSPVAPPTTAIIPCNILTEQNPGVSSVQATPEAPVKPSAGAKRAFEGDTSRMTTKKTKKTAAFTKSLAPRSSGPVRPSSAHPSSVFKIPAVPIPAQAASSVHTSLLTTRPLPAAPPPTTAVVPANILAEQNPGASSVQANLGVPIKPPAGAKRAFEGDTTVRTAVKKTKTLTKFLAPSSSGSPSVQPSSSVPSSSVFKVLAVPGRAQAEQISLLTTRPPPVALPPTTTIIHGNILTAEPQNQLLSKASRKRFQPLLVKKPVSSVGSAQVVPNQPVGHADHLPKVASLDIHACYLDFPLSDSVLLDPITLPPSLSQRKRVPRWAIILSALPDNNTIRQCIQVSRMFRYAVYLSAGQQLVQNFNGRRLAYMLHQYPQSMTNFWPYLHMRKRELLLRRMSYDRSFLPTFFKHRNPISQRLWSSPDNQKQIVVAVRFVLTRLWFLLSIGGHGHDPLAQVNFTVVDAQELVKDEIWSVTVCSSLSSSPRNDIFYVLESTCEVVGHPPAPPTPSGEPTPSEDCLPVRADWSAYIVHRLLPPAMHATPPPPLLAYLKWTNHEEYDRGISKLWLERVGREGEEGAAKREVAERYVLACVVGNSVSGPWMSSTQMAQEFSGLPTQVTPIQPKSPQVHLFLPAHHHVESLHLTTSDKQALHPALAIVQTPGREYYILKDNGMHVGCEEDGVGEVWMQLLGCSQSGAVFCV